MMTHNEELLRLRREARKLRQEHATIKNAWGKQKDRNKKLKDAIQDQTKRIGGLLEENKKLKEEVAQLKSRLGLTTDHAKKLAGMIFKSNVQKGKEGETGKRGARKGHHGYARAKPDHIDRDVDVYLTNCADCGNTLHTTSSVDERIVEDVPEILPVVTRYRIQRQWCGYCHKEVRGIPHGTLPGMRFGVRTIALVLFLKYRMRAPLAKIEEILLSQYKLTITGQGIQELLHTLKVKFSRQYNDILEEFRHAPVKYADETSFRIDGINGWCWLFATPTAALYTIEETRGGDVPKRIVGHDPTGVLVRDDYGAYEKLSMEQQSCWAHLLRVSHDAMERDNASEDIGILHSELKRMFGELSMIIHGPYQPRVRRRQYNTYTGRIDDIIERAYKNNDVKAIQTRIKNQRTNLITAILHEHVPLTNNYAERMIRPMVITRKISGGSRSNKGAATHAVNMTIMQTLSLKGKDFFTGISEILHDGNKHYALGNGG